MLMPKRSRSIASSIVLSALAASALMNHPSISAQSSSPAPTTPRTVGRVERPADSTGPLAVTPSLDSPHAASAIITIDGGTLTATAANGAVFALTIPKGGLVDQQNITMTPVASIPDLPFGGGLAGGGAVQLAPKGLILMETAYPKDYDLYIDIGMPQETITVACPFVPSNTTTKPFWVGQFNCSHAADYYTGLFRIQGWTTGEGDVLASKDYEGAPCQENPFNEDTTIEVRRQ